MSKKIFKLSTVLSILAILIASMALTVSASEVVVFNSCDSLDDCIQPKAGEKWQQTTLDKSDKKEGSAAYSIKFGGNDMHAQMWGKSDALDAKQTMQAGALQMWVFITNAKPFQNSRKLNIEISSSGTCDMEELEWDLGQYIKNDGWNQVILPFDEAYQAGVIDLTKISFWRISGNDIDDFTMKIDDMKFIKKPDQPVATTTIAATTAAPTAATTAATASTAAPTQGSVSENESVPGETSSEETNGSTSSVTGTTEKPSDVPGTESFDPTVLIIIIAAVVVLAGGGAAAFFIMKKMK